MFISTLLVFVIKLKTKTFGDCCYSEQKHKIVFICCDLPSEIFLSQCNPTLHSISPSCRLCLSLKLLSPFSLSLFYPSILPSSSCLFKSRAGGKVPEGISLCNISFGCKTPSPRSDSSTVTLQQKSEFTAVAERIIF